MINHNSIMVRIRCIHRETKRFFDRDVWVDLSSLSEEERKQVEETTKGVINPHRFRSIRRLFHERIGDSNQASEESPPSARFAVPEYFEDESGNPVDDIGLAQILTEEDYPILMDNVNSVLRLGPTGIARKELWDVETANTLAHFFQMVEVVGASEFIQRKLAISSVGPAQTVHDFACPELAHVYSILFPIRQLYSSDDVFNHAAKTYRKHCDNEIKSEWVKQKKLRFNEYLKSQPSPFPIDNYTVRQWLDLVIYGSGLAHFNESKPETTINFKHVITQYSREWVVFVFLWCCHELYRMASDVYFVLRQDFEHWVANEDCAPADLVYIRGLFVSHPLSP